MSDQDRPNRLALALIRGLHSAVFLVELAAILWIVATGLVGRRDRTVVIAVALVAAEGVVWIGNERTCPLTPLAERHGATRGTVSDIFLPDPIARTIPRWSIPLVAFGLALHGRGVLRGRRAAQAAAARKGQR